MQRITRLLLIVSVVFCFSCQQSATEIYVDVNGHDAADGTKANPLRTIEKACELTKSFAGKKQVTILLGDGIYYLANTIQFTSEHSGSKKSPVVLKAVNEGKAIISGGMKLNLKWEALQSGILKAHVSEDVVIDQLYVNGQRQRMARFPNARDGKNVFDAWDLRHTRKPDPKNDPLDVKRIASWSNPEGAYVHAMHRSLWGDMHWFVKGKHADGTLDMEGGWQNNRPSPMHPRYRMVENVFEELDAPGEWYFNKTENALYYYPDAETDMTKATIEIVRLKHLIEFTGTKKNPVRYIELNGLVFRHAARSFMENREQLLRSDWTTYRGGAVFLNGAEDCSIANCEFDQLGGNSVFVNNYNRRISIKSCYIHHSGANGIAFVGDPAMVRSPLFRYGKQDFSKIDRRPGPKGDNYPADCLVEDCLITLTGRDEKQTSPIQISMSHKITVRHCSIYDVPRAGINISEGTFGGHIIEYCDVFNTVLETGDHGSFNSWGRDRFWTPDIRETTAEVKKMPGLPKLDMLDMNIIRNSRWRCDHGWDIDLDDGSTWYRIYNNVLLNGGLKMREGYDRIATNNIIVNNSLHPHVWYPESGDIFKHNIVFAAYKPAVMKRGIAPDGKWGAQLDSNLFVTSSQNKDKFKVNGCDFNSIVGDAEFVNAKGGDFRVHKKSPARQMGFKNFAMDSFGVVSEKLKKIARTPKIPEIAFKYDENQGETFSWLRATVKNVETLGEQSAAGLSSKRGVLLVDVPEYTDLAEAGFRTGAVILKCEGVDIHNFEQLKGVMRKSRNKPQLLFTIMHNQEEVKIKMSTH